MHDEFSKARGGQIREKTQESERSVLIWGELNCGSGIRVPNVSQDSEEKGRLQAGYLLMIQYRLQHLMARQTKKR
ncbi:hypothetical protein H5410_054369 [Solanum commersonii]|uniref:Uncharacterized protein n=1 Tax=Solanum commersonii TaxID=4109 RepID=A0A9J5WER0_SOLCO|nr:hypothetical protein H5410_054369 [Solanum commersonii]